MSTTIEPPSVDPRWRSWNGTHGGYLASLLIDQSRAVLPETATDFAVRAVHVNLLAAVREGEIALDAEPLRTGRTVATVRAELSSGDQLAVTGTATFGANDRTGHKWSGEQAPDAPPAADCPLLPVKLLPFAQNLEIRPANGHLPLAGGTEPVLTAWLRLRTPPADRVQVAMIMLDALPPALYGVLRTPTPIPTVELAAHFAADITRFEPDDWALARIRTDHAADGWCVDDCTLWNTTGAVLATGRQTRRILA